MAADAPAPAAPGVPASVWVVAAVVAGVLAVVSSLLTPLMGLADEPAHAIHAAGVVRGQFAGEDEVVTSPEDGWTRTETAVRVPDAYAALASMPTCYLQDPATSADCAPEVADEAGSRADATSTVGTYAPWWYAAVGWPSLATAPPLALHLMRGIAALAFAALVGLAAASLWSVGAHRWGMAGLVLALPPIAVHLAGGINPSGTEIAAGVAAWAATLELVLVPVTRGAVVRWVVASVVLALVRPLGPAIVVGIPVVVIGAFGPGVTGRLRDDGRVRRGAIAVVVAAGAGMAWSLWRGTLSAFSGYPAPDATGLAAVQRSLSLVPERAAELVGVLGWSDVTLPRLLVWGWLAVVGIVLVVALLRGSQRLRLWLVLLGAAVLVLPILADVRSAGTIGFVWQGRYTLPVAAGLPLLATVALDRDAAPGGVGPRWAPALVATLAGAGHLVALLSVARRFGTGVDEGLVASLGGAAWTPPVPVGALLLVALAAVTLMAVAQWTGQGPVDGEPGRHR